MDDKTLESVEGTIERIQFYNEANGYSVVWMDEAEKGPIVLVGILPGLREGDMVRASGRWIVHAQYGEQFQTSSYTPLLPASLQGIERYLASGVIKGIGPKTAERLVDKFGLNTLEIIEKEPMRLTEVPGIGRAKAETIAAAFASQQGIRALMLFLEEYGVSPSFAARIYKHYGDAGLGVIRDNPYRLADDMIGIGFKTADKVARQIGFDPLSPHRITSGLLYVLNQQGQHGHVFLPQAELLSLAVELLETSEGLEASLRCLADSKQVIMEEQRVYLPIYYWAEQGIARRLVEIRNVVVPKVERLITPTDQQLSARQKEAVEMAMREGVVVITGGPGTGKTTTLRTILQMMQEMELEVLLAAPTGRAAKRMTEATGVEAKTVHRLLEYGQAEGGNLQFQRHQHRPLEADVVVIDEVSMVDCLLMYSLLQSIPPGAQLILVGDADQLPSVGPGSVLRDIVASHVIPSIHLDEIFRQARESLIVVNAHRINQGEQPEFNKQAGDFFLIEEPEPRKIAMAVVELCTKRLPKFMNCDPIEDIQVIAPMKRSTAGVEQLNKELQQAFNPSSSGKAEIVYRDTTFRVGDKVMQIKNNYDKTVFNGDVGRITDIDTEEGEVWVTFLDREGENVIIYDKGELEELVLAYAISVHKSQGSEFPVVVMVVTTQHHVMLQRNLLYTGITRARSLAVLVGTHSAVAKAVANNRISKRYTYLAERLRAANGEQ